MDATDRFAELVNRPESAIPLDEVALLIAAHARPDLDIAAELARLDLLAAGVRVPTLDGLIAHLFADLGFRGDSRRYYDPRNSYLDEVLTRRQGIPITLSVLAITVGRRVGVPLVGVGMPGHFLLRDQVDQQVFVDAYAGGTLLDPEGCARVFARIQGEAVPFEPRYLDPVGPRDIAARMLDNLRNVFVAHGDRRSLTWVLRLRTALPGSPAEDQVDLGAALAAVGRYVDAAHHYEEAARRLGGTLGAEYGRNASRLRARLN